MGGGVIQRELGVGRRVVVRARVTAISSQLRHVQRGRLTVSEGCLVYDLEIGSSRLRAVFSRPRDRAVRRLLAPAAVTALIGAVGVLVLLPVPANLLLAILLSGLAGLAFECVDWADLRVWLHPRRGAVTLPESVPRPGDSVLAHGLIIAIERSTGAVFYRIELVGAEGQDLSLRSDSTELIEDVLTGRELQALVHVGGRIRRRDALPWLE